MCVPKTNDWLRLDARSRTLLLNDSVRETARRSFAGAMVYFATIALLPLASPCLHEHPVLTIGALLCTFIGGLGRCIAAIGLLRQPEPAPSWRLAFKVSTLITASAWGAYCAAIFYFYADTWPSTYLLIAGASLAGGALTSLAPQLRLGGWALAFIVLPTGICGLSLGTAGSRILGASALGYLVFLILQLRHAWKTYWKITIVLALDAMLSRQAATRSEVQFRTLFEDAPSGIYLAFHDGRVEMANGALAQMLGYTSPEEIAGLNLSDFSPERDRGEKRGPVEESGQLAEWESDWRRRDGTQIRVRESMRSVQAGTDTRGRLLGIVRDVTAHFAADQARRQLIEILEGTSDFVESIAATGETLYRNRASRALLDKCKETAQTAANPAKESVWNRSGDEELKNSRLRFADKEGIWQGESWLLMSDSSLVPVSQVVIRHLLSDGSTHSYSIISRDTSAMREAQKALRETEEQLLQAQRLESLGRLAGGIAHDFNNLLTIIMGQTSMLAPAMKDAEAQEGLAEVIKAAARAADLTRQLLAFGRKQVLSKGVIDVKEIVKSAESMLRRLIGERIELVTKLSEEPQAVVADGAQLEQVLVNLVLNGRDAMPHGGLATIETSTIETSTSETSMDPGSLEPGEGGPPLEYVRICVSDTGIGMDEETMSRVFEPFFTTKDRGRGTGLGLATAYGFIKQSGGSISVSSKPGAGTTFTILLPGCAAGVSVAPQQLTLSDLGGNEHVLVVDDEPALRVLLRQTLAGYGYRVVEARDGEEALALASDSPDPFDLLVTDVIMPGMTGPQLAGRLLSLFPGMAVLFISGYPGETEAERAAFGRGASYLAKPFTAEMLLQHARQQLDLGKAGTAKAVRASA